MLNYIANARPHVKNKSILLSCSLIYVLVGCTNTAVPITPGPSYLKAKNQEVQYGSVDEILTKNERNETSAAVSFIKPITFKKGTTDTKDTLDTQFSESKKVKLSAEELPLNEFLHYVMRDVLSVSYILGDNVKQDESTLTLNIQENISHKKLYTLIEELLAEREYVVHLNDGIYYINKESNDNSRGNITFGYGNKVTDVPASSQTIWQMAPFDYGFNGSLQLTLSQLAQVKVFPDSQQNLLSIRGKRSEIIKALEFMRLVDKPKLSQRKIAMYKSVFVNSDVLIERLALLLQQEGISVGLSNDTNGAVSIVALPNMGALTLFSNKQELIERALFWLNKIDQPEDGNNVQYFIYHPQFSRAADLGISLEALLGGSQSLNNSTSLTNENKAPKSLVKSTGIESSNVGLVIDERANSLIFQTTGEEYRKLLPLVKRLDIMPKQIMLEIMIAEVTLTDEFKEGVEFELTNKEKASVSGNFNLSTGSTGLAYILTGEYGHLDLNLFQKNSNVNVLSRPTLLVRDGVTAEMSVGDDIPTVGEIVTDPTNGSRTSIVYRKTGIELSVTPTINAQGVVIMEIDQKISNQAAGDASVAGNPIVSERSFKTEVVADSGQTIILGGLIRDDRTVNDRSVPFFSSIPLFGKLFDSTSDTSTKTELVIMVTPKVIDSGNEWEQLKYKFQQQLEYIKIP